MRDYQQYRPVLGPALVLSLVLLLSLTLGRFLVDRLLATREQIGKVGRQNELLEGKLVTLQSLNQGSLTQDFELAIQAIPSSDSTLFSLATIRQLTNDRSLTINNLRIIGTDPGENKKVGEMRKVELRFDIQGGLTPTVSFLDELRKSAPLMKVVRVRSTISGSAALTNLSILSSWSPLPETIGKVDDPLQTISQDEKNILSQLGQLRPPQGVGLVIPAAPQGRENPFAF